MGRPRTSLARHDYSLVTEMAAKGANESSIAKALRVAPRTFQNLKKRDEVLVEALTVGRAVEEDHLVGLLRRAADDGNLVAAMFLLKSRHGYNDRGGEAANPVVGVQVNLELPKAMTPEEYADTINIGVKGDE